MLCLAAVPGHGQACALSQHSVPDAAHKPGSVVQDVDLKYIGIIFTTTQYYQPMVYEIKLINDVTQL